MQNEVALIVLIRHNTTIPVPEIYGHGTALENPTGLGPFILMDWVDGVRMKDQLQETTALETPPIDVEINPDLSEDTLKNLYSEMSMVLHELWMLDFDRIGTPELGDTPDTWRVNHRPLTHAHNETAQRDGVPVQLTPSDTFSSSIDYFCSLSVKHTICIFGSISTVF